MNVGRGIIIIKHFMNITRSIGNKIDEFRILCVKYSPHFMRISETWTIPDHEEYYNRNNYTVIIQQF
jgi:hypothetical protein